MSNAFDHLRDVLSELHTAEAEDLLGVMSAAYTSSSEMLGEIGLAIRRLQASKTPLPPAVRKACTKALADVHEVWPGL